GVTPELVVVALGSPFARIGLTRAYDRLPWQDREVAAPHLFAAIPQGQALNRAFEGTKRDRRAALQRVSILVGLEPEELDLLASRMIPERYRPGEVIIRQGEAGDKFYVIRRGRVAVSVRDESGAEEKVAELGFGDFFGEAALLSGAPRNATCKAASPTEILSLDRGDFNQLVRPHLEVAGKVERAIEKERLLLRMPHFGDVSRSDLQDLAARLEEVTAKKGEAIIRQGEEGDAFYIVKDGRVQIVVRTPDDQEKEVAELGPGEYFGEMALLVDIPRTATVTALSPLQLLKLNKSDFDEFLSHQLYVSQDLERVSSRRMIDLVRKGAI
ncbi:MAG: cyclic nucleotide-binding domain-containing protein, partial [Anaerolineae bacterium]